MPKGKREQANEHKQMADVADPMATTAEPIVPVPPPVEETIAPAETVKEPEPEPEAVKSEEVRFTSDIRRGDRVDWSTSVKFVPRPRST